MVRSSHLLLLLASSAFLSPSPALPHDTFSGQEALAKALALADLYNWADAAPLFQRAQAAFEQAVIGSLSISAAISAEASVLRTWPAIYAPISDLLDTA